MYPTNTSKSRQLSHSSRPVGYRNASRQYRSWAGLPCPERQHKQILQRCSTPSISMARRLAPRFTPALHIYPVQKQSRMFLVSPQAIPQRPFLKASSARCTWHLCTWNLSTTSRSVNNIQHCQGLTQLFHLRLRLRPCDLLSGLRHLPMAGIHSQQHVLC